MVRVRPLKTSPPGTRSRRLNENKQQQHAKKRLTNGCSSSASANSANSTSSTETKTKKYKFKFDQITTRSRAANNVDSASARRKRRELQLHNNSIIISNNTSNSTSTYSATGAELKRLHIAMRLKHEKVHHSSISISPPAKLCSTNFHNKPKAFSSPIRNPSNSSGIVSHKNGLRRSNKNNISPPRPNHVGSNSKNENKLNYRHQVLSNYSRKRKLARSPIHQRRHRQENDHDADDDDTTDSENRDRKNRRSALWVLNCEAEEFLFGETAAEKHEVVLPPKSIHPPAKRRRMRATELGELLKETPLLESKLRKLASSGSESSLLSLEEKLGKRIGVKRRVFNDDNSDNSLYVPGVDDEDSSELMVSTTTSCTTPSFTSSSSCIGSPRIQDYFLQSVRLQNILKTLDLRFSFEDIPSNEVWYQTFSRQETPNKSFQPLESPLILPYERSSLSKRALARFSKLPRKSPRCHASTLAILSSLKPTRTRLASGLLALAAGPPPCSLPCSSSHTPVSTRSLHSHDLASSSHNSTHLQHPKQCSSSSIQFSLPQTSPTSKYRRNLSCSWVEVQPLPAPQSSMHTCELKATPYVWDTLQFLDDPYVVQLLAEEDVLPPIRKSFFKLVPTSRSRAGHKLRKLDKTNVTNKIPNKPTNCSTTKLIVASPKTSPKLQNGSHNPKVNCCYSLERALMLVNSRSPPLSPKLSSSSSRGSSRPSSPISRPSSPPSIRKSKRKSPIVLVADILKNTLKSNSSKHGALKDCYEEEVLFLSGDCLPPLPSLA